MIRDEGTPSGSDRILAFEDREDGPGLSVVDYVERRRCEVCTARPVSPREVSEEAFHHPVDCAVAMTAEEVVVTHTVTAYVRDRRGTLLEEATKSTERRFPKGYYRIELTAPIKLYVVVEAGFEIAVTAEEVTLEFDRAAEVHLGARSNHDHPAATITTTDDTADLMRALSAFGSALKTTTCERSYPTLRGHPPRIERGERLAIPGTLDAPDTGITVEVPPTRESVYVVASLAYYLGADVAPGPEPRLVTDDGFVHALDGRRGFEREVERVLKQCFLLDCVTRTEGYYPVDLHERNEIEDAVALDFPALYGRPLAEQVEAYLDVPYEVVEPHVPRWKLTAHVDPAPAHAEVLPFLVQDLAAIRTKEAPSTGTASNGYTPESMGITEFIRGRRGGPGGGGDGERRIVRIDASDALEDVWIGEGIPIGASKGLIEGFRNRLERTPSDGDIDITVVVNDPGMIEEGRDVNEVYGSRENLPFDVTILQQLATEELSDVLCTGTDFLHYIGHVDENGFQCEDGSLNVKQIDATGVDAFFLNACESYRQGKRLIESGAIAGATTLTSVPNQEAEQMGKKLARLLNIGFPLYSAVDIATIGQTHDYVVIGDGGINIAQPTGRAASLCEIEKEGEKYRLTYKTHTTRKTSIGSITKPFLQENEKFFLSSGKNGEFLLDKEETNRMALIEELPVITNSEVYFGDSIV